MKGSLVLLSAALLACTGCDKLRGLTGGAAQAGTAAPAADSMKVDKVTGHDGPIETDGSNDGAVSLSVDGPVAAIMLLTCDKSGAPESGQQWDTYVAGQKVPAATKAPYEDGDATWQLGVFENGKLLNDKKGSLTPLGAGPHKLTLYASDSGYFTKDNHFVVFVERPDHSVARSNVFTF